MLSGKTRALLEWADELLSKMLDEWTAEGVRLFRLLEHLDFHLIYGTVLVIEMVNSFVWDGSDLFNGSVAVVEAAIAELFLKLLHLMSLPTNNYRAVKDFVDDQCRGPSIKEKHHIGG